MKISPVRIAVSMLVAILITDRFGLNAIYASSIAAVFLFAGILIIRHKADLGIFALLVAFCAASLSYLYASSSYAHKSIDYINRFVTINGTTLSAARNSAYNGNYKYTLRINSIEHRFGTDYVKDDILLTTPQKLACGESVSVKGMIDELPKKMNENGFDSAKHYKSKNLYTRIYSDEIESIDKIRIFSPYMISEKINEKINSVIFTHFSDNEAAILSAVITGNNTHFDSEYSYVLGKTAFKRLFHPAYIHIGIIIALISLLRKILKRQLRDILTVIIFVGYAFLQCTNIGFTRCLICAAATAFFRMRYGRAHFPDTLAAISIFCAITMPTIIFNAGFVLSMSGGLVVWAFMPYVTEKLLFIPRPLRRTSAVMLICMLLLTPVTVYYYSGICPYSFILPFITAPVIFILLIICPVTLLLLNVFSTAPVLKALVEFLLRFLHRMPYFIEGLPLSNINIKTPSAIELSGIILLIFCAYYFTRNKRRKIIICLSASAVFFTISIAQNIPRLNKAEFTFVNVGQGDGAIIHTPLRDTIIIDGGGGSVWSNYDPGKMLFLPYLQAEGYNHIDAAVVSHYHQDHIQGVIWAIDNIKTDIVYAPQIKENDSDSMKEWANLLAKTARENGTQISYITGETHIEFDSGITLEIYVPKADVRNISENNTTNPVIVRYGDFAAVYTGDMDTYAEKSFMKQADVDAEILKVSHHGSKNASGTEFISEVSPVYSVISCGENNVYNHPAPEAVKRLNCTEILRTDKLGDIKIAADKTGACRIMK